MVKKTSIYQVIELIESSNYQKCKNKENGELVAIKLYKGTNQLLQGKQLVRNLKRCQHDHVVQLKEVSKRKGRLSLVLEYLPLRLLDIIQENENGLKEDLIKEYVFQCLKAIHYCHAMEVFHRDIKPEKILLEKNKKVLKLAGFGLSRKISSNQDHTKHVTTSWYRSPEVILERKYSKEIDLWSLGCVMAELVDSQPLFPGETAVDVLYLIEQTVGPLTEVQKKICRKNPKFSSILRSKKQFRSLDQRYQDKLSSLGLSLLKGLLNVDLSQRLTAEQALSHPWFQALHANEKLKPTGNPKKSQQKPHRRRYPVKVTSTYTIQVGASNSNVTVSFHRVQNKQGNSHQFFSLGKVPIHRIDDYMDCIPESWKRHGGIFIGLKAGEKFALSIEHNSKTPKGVQIAYGSVNVFTGDEWNRESRNMKDYLIINSDTTVNGILKESTGVLTPFIGPLHGQEEATIMQMIVYGTKMVNPGKKVLPTLAFPNIGSKANIKVPDRRTKKRSKFHKYEILTVVAEGTYGVVMKARNRETGQICAIKRFKDYDQDDEAIRKIILREKKILKMLQQQNIIAMQESFRKNGKMHLVFEYVPKSLLDVLQENENGLDYDTIRIIMYQLLKALAYCHSQDIIHRDVKLENVLLYEDLSLKLCDFGFSRIISKNNTQTEYVSTRWYRSPELLVAADYGKPVDVWAAGCIMGELLDGRPLFAGNTDLDQLFIINKTCGDMPSKQIEAFHKKYDNYEVPENNQRILNLRERFQDKLDENGMAFLECMLKLDPDNRLDCQQLLKHKYFQSLDVERIVINKQNKIKQEAQKQESSDNPSLPLLLTSWHQGNPKPNHNTYSDDLSMKPPKPAINPLSKKQQQQGKKTPREITQFSKKKPTRDYPSPYKSGQSPLRALQQGKRRNSFVASEHGSRSSSRQSSRQSSSKSRTPSRNEQPSIDLDHFKFGRFYIHVVNNETYKLLTGYDLGEGE